MLARIKRNLFLGNLFYLLLSIVTLIGAVAILIGYMLPYFRAKYSPPTPITVNDLRGDIAIPTYFANVTGEVAVDSGLYYESTILLVIKSYEYYSIMMIGDQLLLLKTGNTIDETQLNWTGTLEKVTDVERREVINVIEAEIPELRGSFLPYVLDVVDTYNWVWWAGSAVMFAFTVAGIFGIIGSLQRMADIEKNKLWQQLMNYGNDVPATIDAIDRDMQGPSEKMNHLTVTRHWLIRQRPPMTVMKLDDLVWIYKGSVKQYSYGIHVGTTHAAHFYDKYGAQITVQAKEAKVGEYLSTIYSRAPWVATGYSDELDALWKNDHPRFIEGVRTRKRTLEAESKE